MATDFDATAHHYGLIVSDLEREIEFYRDVLGLDVLTRFTVGDEAFGTAVGIDGASAELVHLDAGGARLELATYEPEPDADFETQLNQPGSTHLGLAVEDLESVAESLPDDVETISGPQTTESGTTIMFVVDPEGNLVELLDA
ncbi:VOC family protein [Haloarcula salina]|uniref:VOC family protein n=1 Tax=Haloarcula salina TaxID=1429914 RepID=A0AA41KKZ9_9EURY|nr:VOC family protein [Haloarcula salina]MBV0902364.1 VOC family protein [Haloarcula salina]